MLILWLSCLCMGVFTVETSQWVTESLIQCVQKQLEFVEESLNQSSNQFVCSRCWSWLRLTPLLNKHSWTSLISAIFWKHVQLREVDKGRLFGQTLDPLCVGFGPEGGHRGPVCNHSDDALLCQQGINDN